jgi:hypothetical protein
MFDEGSFFFNLQTDTTITGDLDLTLTFDQSVHQLKVVVHDAHGLKITDVDDNTTCSFARVYITGIPSKQDSQVRAVIVRCSSHTLK